MDNRLAILICLALFAVLISQHQNIKREQNPSHTTEQQTNALLKKPEVTPPTPPIRENFDGKPLLSLFPRLGDFRPEDDDRQRLSYWKTFVEHVSKTAGPALTSKEQDNRAWSFRSINSLDSVGWFSPLAVEPATIYRIQVRLKTDLPEGASAGIGILEFKDFLWLSEQYTESVTKEFQSGIHEGVRRYGTLDWQQIDYRFTSGPNTRMIHLILFREGAHDRNPVMFDDISIEMVE